MKRYLIIAVATLVFMVSCQRENNTFDETSPVSVLVDINGSRSTKAAGSSDFGDTLVHSLQVYCFNQDLSGRLEQYHCVTSKQCTLSVVSGLKHIYALVNFKDSLVVDTEDEFLKTVTNFADNSIGSFHMLSPIGVDAEYSITKDICITLPVKRFVSKVIIRKLTASFTQPSLQDLDFIVNGICLDRVAKSNNLACTAVSEEVFYAEQDNGAAVNGMIRDTCNYVLTGNKSLDVMHSFYAYPGSSSTATKFVIKATLMGIPQTYSFDLPVLERNKLYDISEVTITRPSGGLTDVTFNVRVEEWDTTEFKFN